MSLSANRAITKEKVLESKRIPDIIIDAVNNLLIREYDVISKKAIIRQSEILDLVIGDPDCGKFSREQIFKNKWLNFEYLYEAQGWVVTYDKPAYNESYEPFFTFK